MTLLSVIHQNLMCFVGDNNKRAALFEGAFKLIRQDMDGAELPASMMASFTELETGGGVTRTTISEIAEPVMSCGSESAVVTMAVGYTALGNSPEYVGIVYDPNVFTATGTAQALRVSKSWQIITSTTTSGMIPLPKNVSVDADHRGVAFIYGTISGKDYLFGFAHNVYAINSPGTLMQALPDICGQVVEDAGLEDPQVILGGDFNCDPANRQGTIDLTAYATANGMGGYHPTTQTHTYDYWMLSQYILAPSPWVSSRTRNKSISLSDHCAVILQFGIP